MSLDNYSREELEAQLKKLDEQKKKLEKPKRLEVCDFSSVIKSCQEFIDGIDENGYGNDNYQYWIFESAIEAVFGKDVWGWVNKKLKS